MAVIKPETGTRPYSTLWREEVVVPGGAGQWQPRCACRLHGAIGAAEVLAMTGGAHARNPFRCHVLCEDKVSLR
jgi:hypothetical protein